MKVKSRPRKKYSIKIQIPQTKIYLSAGTKFFGLCFFPPLITQICFFFLSSCRCTLVFLLDGYRSAQTPVATVSSGPRWGRYARECSLLHSVQSSVATWVEPCESSWRRGGGGGGGIQGWLDGFCNLLWESRREKHPVSCCWRKTEWHQRSAGAGTTLARGIGHKCYQAASGDMRTLSPSSPSYHCLLCLGRIKASQRPDVLVLEEQVLGGQWKFTVPSAVLGKSSEVSGDICDPRRGHRQVTGANTSKVPVCKM